MGATHLSGLSIKPESITTSTFVLDEWNHSGKPISLDRAAGWAGTLPAATGSGARFILFVGTTVTGASTIKVSRTADIMAGYAIIDSNTTEMYATAADSDTITFAADNGSGGAKGSTIELIDIKANLWQVIVHGNGAAVAAATPFSASV